MRYLVFVITTLAGMHYPIRYYNNYQHAFIRSAVFSSTFETWSMIMTQAFRFEYTTVTSGDSKFVRSVQLRRQIMNKSIGISASSGAACRRVVPPAGHAIDETISISVVQLQVAKANVPTRSSKFLRHSCTETDQPETQSSPYHALITLSTSWLIES